MSTAHANSPADLLRRIETMALMSDVDLPVEHVREQIASTIDLVLHLSRLPDGRRVVARVTAIDGMESGAISLRELMAFPASADARGGAGATPTDVVRMENHVRGGELVRGSS